MMLRSSSVTKLISGTPGRKTRFHTHRGDAVPLEEWPRAARALWDRLTRRELHEPWLAPSAVRFLDSVIGRDSIVAELGAGASTSWFAERAARVISVEHDEGWASRVHAALDAAGFSNVELHVVPLSEFDPTLERVTLGTPLDVLLVDQTEAGSGGRIGSVALGRTLIRPGGYLVLDDSDWPSNRPAFEVLHDWRHVRFVGVRARPFQATETTVFRRPAITGETGG
jgi:predicted O-methyltransferase YrrM